MQFMAKIMGKMWKENLKKFISLDGIRSTLKEDFIKKIFLNNNKREF